jgi:hypothetical protein
MKRPEEDQESLYPLPRPAETGDDPRFTIGLDLDVAAVLVKHGYPPVASGADLLRLQMALFEFLYIDRPR